MEVFDVCHVTCTGKMWFPFLFHVIVLVKKEAQTIEGNSFAFVCPDVK